MLSCRSARCALVMPGLSTQRRRPRRLVGAGAARTAAESKSRRARLLRRRDRGQGQRESSGRKSQKRSKDGFIVRYGQVNAPAKGSAQRAAPPDDATSASIAAPIDSAPSPPPCSTPGLQSLDVPRRRRRLFPPSLACTLRHRLRRLRPAIDQNHGSEHPLPRATRLPAAASRRRARASRVAPAARRRPGTPRPEPIPHRRERSGGASGRRRRRRPA